jgi:hypothetical protein
MEWGALINSQAVWNVMLENLQIILACLFGSCHMMMMMMMMMMMVGGGDGVSYLCDIGKWSVKLNNTGVAFCGDADMGYYVNLPGTSSELQCDAGSYADVTGLDACLPCDEV